MRGGEAMKCRIKLWFGAILVCIAPIHGWAGPVDSCPRLDATSDNSGQSAALLSHLRPKCLIGLPPLPSQFRHDAASPLVGIGEQLFFDTRLSRDGKVSCGSCHKPEHAFADPRSVSVGIEGRHGRRNSPSVINTAFLSSLLWDGSADTLEHQIRKALTNPHEMGALESHVVGYLQTQPHLSCLLNERSGEKDGISAVSRAIAAYVRSIIVGNSAVDRFLFGDDPNALTASQVRGFKVFVGKGHCSICHTVRHRLTHPFGGSWALFSDNRFHNLGIGVLIRPSAFGREKKKNKREDLGREEVTGNSKDRGKFRTPMLRNVALTAPYMHDGSLPTLEAVVAFYDRGGRANDNLDPIIRPLHLSDGEKNDLVAFLSGLTTECSVGDIPNSRASG